MTYFQVKSSKDPVQLDRDVNEFLSKSDYYPKDIKIHEKDGMFYAFIILDTRKTDDLFLEQFEKINSNLVEIEKAIREINS